MVTCHHLQLRCGSLLFCNLKQFNIKVVAAYHPVIQKELDEPLAKGVIEPSTDCAGFYSTVFVMVYDSDAILNN